MSKLISISNLSIIDALLDRPELYSFSQMLLAPGSNKIIRQKYKQLLDALPSAHQILDVGCGPFSQLWQIGLKPIGLDLSYAYAKAFSQDENLAITASAELLPFPDNSFEGIWVRGLIHHLPDEVAQEVIKQLLRVCQPKGYIVIWDGVLPHLAWRRPMAYILRQLDRGNFMRREEEFRALLPTRQPFVVERITYSLNGLEAMLAYTICEK